jgi:hypothetical protein
MERHLLLPFKLYRMKRFLLIMSVVIALTGCEKDDDDKPEAIIVTASGNINSKVDEFRTLLGATLNTTPGQTSGRREIDWDAVPDQFATQKLPTNFFNPTAPGSPANLQRGFRYSDETDARISSNNFADFEATNGTEFAAFSGAKTFSAVNNVLWDVFFEVPGQSSAASVKGFGAVFSDVDNAGSTSIEFFSGTRSLGVYNVPVKTTGSYSFLGVYFPNEKVTRIRIMQGAGVVANGVKDISVPGGTKDLVIMDDFLYDEPKAIQ